MTIAAMTACTSGMRTADQSAPPRPAVSTGAARDAVWSSALAVLADRSIPIKSSDKASGLITTEEVAIAPSDMKQAGECAKGIGGTARPGKAQYMVLVAGDSSATLRVTSRLAWYNIYGGKVGDCASSGVLEGQLEQAIRARARR